MTRLPSLSSLLVCVLLGAAQLLTAADATAQTTVALDTSFDSGADGFSYQDDAFRSTNQPAYASGAFTATGGLTGGGLTVTLGNIDNNSITNMSGGWEHSFSVAAPTELELSFQYKLTQAADYESDEYAQALVELDGALLGQNGPDYIVQITGDGNSGGDLTTGWVEFRQNVGTLSAGTHTLKIGAYNNKKTYNNEWTEIVIDDVTVASPAPPPPPNLAAQALVDALSLQNFKDNIQFLSSPDSPIGGSRHWTQPGNQAAVDSIKAQLESYGYTNVTLHPYTYNSQTRYNVYATKIGSTNPDEMYIVSAHLDSKTTDGSGDAAAAGADDDASGTSLVLEAARVFANPNIETDYSVRFVLWNNEETGLIGAAAYVNEFRLDQGVESPPGSGQYPEPTWRGMIQHDMILWDHGLPYVPGAPQNPDADIDIEYNASETFGGAAITLANALLAGNATYATDYPAEVTDQMSNTDSARFEDWTAAVSLRENRRLAELGSGSNPHYHTSTDVFESYSDLDYLFGFNTVQTTVGAVAELAGASLTTTCGDGTLDAGEDCDDGNTADGDCCSASCQYEAAGNTCEDGDLCSANDTCNATGVCTSGAPLVCGDDQFCNGIETCDSQVGCVAGTAPNADDGVACTVDSCDEVSDSIVHAPNDGLCDNGQFCDGSETCDAVNDCQAGAAAAVDDGVSCTVDSCDEVSDTILHAASDALCDNGLFCDGTETCDAVNDCQAGTAPIVDDGVACTVDSCDEVADAILNAANDSLCDNGLFCDGSELCDVINDCQAGSAPVVDDGVGCTADSCDEASDTIAHTASDVLCDNGLFCDGTETCDAVNDCQAGTPPVADDGVGCTADSCNEASDTIVHTASDALCDNGQFCDGTETCDAVNDCQAGTPPAVDDGVACTVDSCDEVADAILNAANSSLCDNGLFCDGTETCDVVNDCQAGAPPVVDDGVSCTADSCDEANDVVLHITEDALCDNGLFCDGTETCDVVSDCQAGAPPVVDDGVGCTADSCDEASDAIVHTASDALCDNSQFCDGTETCDAQLGCQAGTAPVVDDGVGCTADSCNEASDTITHTASDALCDNGQFCDGSETCDAVNDCQAGTPPAVDDGVACTVDSCDEAGDRVVNAANSSLCDNGLFCDGTEICDVVNDCQAGAPPVADDGVACTVDSCDEVFDVILNAANDSLCDNGLFCDGTEVCDAVNDCQAGTAVAVDDGVTCTVDSCDEATDTITHTASDALCDNSLFCDGTETCDAVNDCQAGTAVAVDDGVSCTADSCDEATDTIVHTASDALCDNGLFCDGTETCDAVNDCQTGTAPIIDDGVGCTDDSCDEAGDRVVNAANSSLCDNGLFCDGTETCDVVNDCQAGAAPIVDDGVGCTADSCDEANDVVLHITEDALCDNGLFCDGTEVCDAVNDCQAGTAVAVDDGVTCTVDSCDEATDTITHTASDALCDNSLFCDGTETCDAVNDCQAGTAVAVDDGVSCTADSCDEENDVVLHITEDALCDNGLFCDGTETCDAVNDCQTGTAPIIDDGVGCTDDSCDEAGDRVVNAANSSLCDNGLFCDGTETCDVVNDCQAGAAPIVDDGVGCTADSCDEANDVVLHITEDALCDNGLFCDGTETCDAVNDCQAGTAVAVDDGVTCTVDSCDEATDTITHTASDALCDNSLFCDGTETCDAVNDCQTGTAPVVDDGVGCTADSCDEATDTIVHTASDALCDNGQFCDGSETCDAANDCQAGTAPVIDDGIACTDDSCDEAGDRVINAANSSLCDNGLFCDGSETCDVVNDCQAGTAPIVDDGVGCTADSCDEANDVVLHITEDALCDNGLFCDGTETCDAVNDCQAGTAVALDDGVSCTADSCDETTDTITHTASDALCDNSLFCDGTETCDAINDCQAGTAPVVDDGVGCTADSCDEATDTIVHATSDAFCDNGQFCDGTETCDAANDCQAGTAPVIDDGIACTDDSCDEASDTVVNAVDDSACDNGLFCDGAETCAAGLGCQLGTDPCDGGLCDEANALCAECLSDLDCVDDGNACSDEVCAVGSCQSVPNSDPCDDGIACTEDDQCSDGSCQPGLPNDGLCDDENVCTDDVCDLQLGCQSSDNTASCDDGDACTDPDQCSGGVCEGTDICLADGTCYLPSTQVVAYTFFQEPEDGAVSYAPGSGGGELGFTTEILVDENGGAIPGVRKDDPTTGSPAVYAFYGDGGSSSRHTARVTLDPVDVSGLNGVSLTVISTPLDSGNGFETADYMKIAVQVEDASGHVNEIVLIDTLGQDMDKLGLTGVPFDTFTLTLPTGSVQATVVFEGSRSGPSEEILFDSVTFTALGVDPSQDQLLVQAEAFDSSTVSSINSAAWLISPDEIDPSDDVYTNALEICNVDDIPGYVQALPDAGRTHKSNPFGTGPVLTYHFEIVQGGTYRIWLRAAAIDGASDSFYLRVRETDGGSWWRWNPSSDRYNGRTLDGDFTDEWQGSGAFGNCTAADAAACASYGPMEEFLAPGFYTLDIAMREDGSAIDAIVLDGSGTFAGTDPAAN